VTSWAFGTGVGQIASGHHVDDPNMRIAVVDRVINSCGLVVRISRRPPKSQLIRTVFGCRKVRLPHGLTIDIGR